MPRCSRFPSSPSKMIRCYLTRSHSMLIVPVSLYAFLNCWCVCLCLYVRSRVGICVSQRKIVECAASVFAYIPFVRAINNNNSICSAGTLNLWRPLFFGIRFVPFDEEITTFCWFISLLLPNYEIIKVIIKFFSLCVEMSIRIKMRSMFCGAICDVPNVRWTCAVTSQSNLSILTMNLEKKNRTFVGERQWNVISQQFRSIRLLFILHCLLSFRRTHTKIQISSRALPVLWNLISFVFALPLTKRNPQCKGTVDPNMERKQTHNGIQSVFGHCAMSSLFRPESNTLSSLGLNQIRKFQFNWNF